MTKEVRELIEEGYHNNDKIITTAIERLVQKFPIIEHFSIGQTVNNNSIHALRVRLNKTVSGKPAIALLGGIHGDHALGHEIVLQIGAFLAESHQSGSSRVKNLLEYADVILIPTLNPDGFEIAVEGDCYSAKIKSGRHNANGVDLDQDFKFHNYNDISAVLSSNKLQPETKSFVDWLVSEGRNVQLFGTLRTGYEGITYPLDEFPNQITEHTYRSPGSTNSPNVAPDSDLFEYIGHNIYYRYQDEPTNSKCNPVGGNTTVLDGARMGSVYGSLNDFLYEFADIFPFNIYIDCCKYPPKDRLKTSWLKHSNSLIAFMEAIKLGLRGSVVEKSSSKPIQNARIFVRGIDRNVSSNYDGTYWRPLVPGKPHDMIIEADGYAPVSRDKITTSEINGDGLVDSSNMNFKLVRLSPKTTQSSESSDKTSPEVGLTHKLKPEILFSENLDRIIENLDFKSPTELHKHHNETELFDYLRDLNSRFSKISRIYSIGLSSKGKKLWVIEISDKPGVHQLMKPEFRYIGNIHGNEVVGRELLLNLAKLLLENYGTNELVTSIVNSTRIHLLPSMNPDGYELSVEGDCDSEKGRANAHGMDLNRNFPDRFGPTKDNKITEPEVASIMKWSHEHPFVLGANLHGGAEVANYPFDANEQDKSGEYASSPDDELFVHLAKTYASNHPTMHKGQHCSDICGDDANILNERFKDGITNGAKWYVLYGGIQDWVYLNTGCMSITVELGCRKYPRAKYLPDYWKNNKKSLIKYLLQVHRGIYGIVTDQNSKPLANATITVRGIHYDVHSTSSGDYWRLLLPGEYFISVSKEGYRTAHRTVTIGTGGLSAKRLDFFLSSGPKDLSYNDIGSVELMHTSNQSREPEKSSHENTLTHTDGNLGKSPAPPSDHNNNTKAGFLRPIVETPDTRYMLALCFMIVFPSLILIIYFFKTTEGKREKLGFYRLATTAPDELDGDDADEGTRFMKGSQRNNRSSGRGDGHASDSEDELYSAGSWGK